MSRIVFAVLPIFAAACLWVPAQPLRAEETGELERVLEKKCAELTVELIEARMKFKPDSPEIREKTDLLQGFQEALARQKAAKDVLKNQITEHLARMKNEMFELRIPGREADSLQRRQFLDQLYSALQKKLIEMDVGPLQFADDAQNPMDKNFKNTGLNSKLHLKLANGTELDAEGPFLQQSAEAREILEQFADPAKDGAISFRIPDPMDLETAAQLMEMIKKIAPKAEVTANEKLRLIVATSDDPAQLRRVAGVFKTLRPNGFDPNNPKMKGDFNPGMKGQFGDGGDMKRPRPACSRRTARASRTSKKRRTRTTKSFENSRE